MALSRVPHYECNHRATKCRDCDGSPMPATPWRTFISNTDENTEE